MEDKEQTLREFLEYHKSVMNKDKAERTDLEKEYVSEVRWYSMIDWTDCGALIKAYIKARGK